MTTSDAFTRAVTPFSNRTSIICHELSAGWLRIKKQPRLSEIDRPEVAAQRGGFLSAVQGVGRTCLVFIDEAGANLAWTARMRGEE